MADPLVRANDTWVLQLEKADPRVDYKMAAAGADQRCGNCRYYSAIDMSCNLVEGSISSNCVCDLWTEPLGAGMMWSEQDRRFQVFVEVDTKAFADLNPWIPFLPKPGKFQHPLYGEINITPESNQAMVDSVKNSVYQQHIPIDAEHDTKQSGAMAWIQGMRLNSDGSADAYVEWTDRGKSLVEGGAFKYISPEWFDEWKDPATGVVHRNVVAGGAITTRPFFKELSLRALVASETGATIISKQEDTRVPNPVDPKVPEPTPAPAPTPTPAPAPEPVTFTEAQEAAIAKRVAEAVAEAKKTAEPAPADGPKDFTETQQYRDMTERLQAAETANRTLTESLVSISNRERAQRFTDLVGGHGGANDGGPWVGDQAKNVQFLEQLADKVGETDPMFTSFVEQQNAIAAQAKMASLFTEIGSSAPAASTDADTRLEAMTKAKMAAAEATGTKITHAKAYSEVLASPEGSQIYQAGEVAKQAARKA